MSSAISAVPRPVIYARQSVDEEQGIGQQLDDCRAECQRRGWQIAGEFQDNDTSASKERGPKTAWAAMLKAFDSDEFDTIIVTETSRITRSLVDVLDIRPPRRDIRVVVIREAIDTEHDDFMLKQLVLLAEREVKIKGARAARYAATRRAAGHPTPGKPPHGYRWVPQIERDSTGIRYRIDDAEAEDVRQIFREFLSGAPLGQIARDLSEAGRLTRRGSRWSSSTVRRVLLNPVYAALLAPAQPSGEYDATAIDLEACTPGSWGAIVERDHLVAARSRLIGTKPNHNGTARKWLLSGLAVCAVCSAPVRSARGETHPTARADGSGAAQTRRYHAYRCVQGHFMRNGDIIDDFVSEVCIARLSEVDAVQLVTPRADGVDVGVLHANREGLKTRRQSIARFVARGLMTDLEADDSLREIADEMRSISEAIARAVREDPLAELAEIDDVRAWWSGGTLARQRLLVEHLMTVKIHPVGHGKRVTNLDAAEKTVTIRWKRD
ncbi:recombinase family protein [Microbacterium sp. nov. GSS16]|uniref:recombinase family protein n=1 Tax=Microbacterium sp. nov. GSS16 TaxID=3019890 RepID=UPI00230677C3|nr:recombinase family protein [Microbacterium sp. nov. GSS16]WCD91448.1 recombinase family protein [Microbacterium sp. nov. GSS16]